MNTARRHFIAVTLIVFFLNPLILFAGEEDNQIRAYGSKSDLSFQAQELKSLELDRKNTKLSSRLNQFILQKTADDNLLKELSEKNTGLNLDQVRVILDTSNDIDHISDRIKSYGARILSSRGGLIVIEVPVDKIEAMVSEIDDIKYVRFPLRFFNQDEISEGVDRTGATNFHTQGFEGAGVKVAVIDAGFKDLKEAHLNGDIPYRTRIRDFTGRGIETQFYHGTACAEVIHDMAPQAELYLLKVYDEADIYKALDYCVENNIDVINFSLSTFGTGPGDGTGPFDEAFVEARTEGIFVVAAAGNFATRTFGDISNGHHWEGSFYDSNDDNVHEFIPGDLESNYNVIAARPSWDDDGNPQDNEVTIVMRWNDWPYSNVDYNIYLYDHETKDLLSSSTTIQNGSQPPTEQIVIDIPDNENYPHKYDLSVRKATDAPEGIELELYLGGTSVFVKFDKYSSPIATSLSSIGEPADAEGVLAVGAIDYMKWETGPQGDFSSQGPTNAWNGNSYRIKPDIMGPDGVTTFTFGISSFSGTSSSSPHLVGAAALILSMYPGLSPEELQSFIESGATDMGDTGKDNLYGLGRLEMDFDSLNNNLVPDKDSDQIPDSWEELYGLDPDLYDAADDPDNDGYSNLMEFLAGTDPYDSDSDDDGISDGDEDVNQNQILDAGETHALWPDTDGDGIKDGDEDSGGSSSSGSSSGGGGGGGCFIATAAFGSQIEPQVKVLREFRDNILLKSRPGKIFVDYYYRYSPPVADYIAKHNTLRALVRWSLMPLVCASWLILRLGLIGVLTSLIILSTFSFYILINREYGKP